MIRRQDDASEIRLTAGIAFDKFLFPFIVERRQFVIVVLGDRLEIDGLPGSGDVVSNKTIDANLTDFSSPCSIQWACQGPKTAHRGTCPQFS